MTKLNISTKPFPPAFHAELMAAIGTGRYRSNNNPETAEYSKFKAQLKRAVDSVEAPEYLIDAIKSAIRR